MYILTEDIELLNLRLQPTHFLAINLSYPCLTLSYMAITNTN
jgi:hypothetical protein